MPDFLRSSVRYHRYVIWHKNEKLRNRRDKYQSYKIALSKLIRQNGLGMMSKDTEVINRIFDLLTEN